MLNGLSAALTTGLVDNEIANVVPKAIANGLSLFLFDIFKSPGGLTKNNSCKEESLYII